MTTTTTTTTYTISDGNATFSGLSAADARAMAARWYAEPTWDSETDLGRLQDSGVDLSVEYMDDEDPEAVAYRVTQHVSAALADQDVEDGRRDAWCDLRRDHYAACRITVTEDITDADE